MSNHPKRVHGLEAARAGDVGDVLGQLLGPCPSCGADLHVTYVQGVDRVDRAIMHPVPFCTYFAETDPAAIERAVVRDHDRKQSEN